MNPVRACPRRERGRADRNGHDAHPAHGRRPPPVRGAHGIRLDIGPEIGRPVAAESALGLSPTIQPLRSFLPSEKGGPSSGGASPAPESLGPAPGCAPPRSPGEFSCQGDCACPWPSAVPPSWGASTAARRGQATRRVTRFGSIPSLSQADIFREDRFPRARPRALYARVGRDFSGDSCAYFRGYFRGYSRRHFRGVRAGDRSHLAEPGRWFKSRARFGRYESSPLAFRFEASRADRKSVV